MVKSISWPKNFGIQDGEFKLDRVLFALKILGNPHLSLKNVIHIAGTNGKGSTIAYLKSIFLQSGYTCNVYTSPNLIHINERFNINNEDISDSLLEKYLSEVKNILENAPKNNKIAENLTFFEGLTAVAFYIFNQIKSDFILLETGLGGHYDATNVIPNPLLTIITSISIDHVEFLGSSISGIAFEKAGIIKKNRPVILAKQEYEDAKNTINAKAKLLNCPFFYYEDDFPIKIINKHKDLIQNKVKYPLPNMDGKFQIFNVSTAIFAAKYLSNTFENITNESISLGIKNTKWDARLQKIENGFIKNITGNRDIDIIVDCGHNVGSAKNIMDFIIKKSYEYDRIYISCGFLKKKDIKAITKELTKEYISAIYACNMVTAGDYAMRSDKLCEIFTQNGFNAQESLSVIDSIKDICNIHKKDQKALCLVYGSFYISGELLDFNENGV